MKNYFNYKKTACFLLILNIIFIFSGFCFVMLNPAPSHAAAPVEPMMIDEGCFPETPIQTETLSHNHSDGSVMPCCIEKQDHGDLDVSLQNLDFLKLPLVFSSSYTHALEVEAAYSYYSTPSLSPPEKPHLESIVIRI